jgi:hypothetical protein
MCTIVSHSASLTSMFLSRFLQVYGTFSMYEIFGIVVT